MCILFKLTNLSQILRKLVIIQKSFKPYLIGPPEGVEVWQMCVGSLALPSCLRLVS